MKRLLIFLVLSVLTVSCLNDVDFEQSDNLEVIVPYNIAFIHFKTIQSDFLSESNNYVSISQEFYPNLNDDFKSRIYSDITLLIEVENTFDSGFDITIEFRDDSDNLLQNTMLDIPSNAGSTTNSTFKETLVLPLDVFLQTRKVITTITPLTSTLTGNSNVLSLKSKLSFDVKY